MKNFEKYKTADERANALRVFCNSNKTCKRCTLNDATDDVRNCAFHWLELEAKEEKPLPCPFCGGETHTNSGHVLVDVVHYWVDCMSPECMYRSAHCTDRAESIAAHNRVARAVRAAKESEVHNE